MNEDTYKKIINAVYDENHVRVYQAFNSSIADAAVLNQKFTEESGWKLRTTWIKPSFCWMLYRSGYGTKSNQERILAIDIKRESFEWILENHVDAQAKGRGGAEFKQKKKIIVQWDPERDLQISKLDGVGDIRSIQIGIKPAKIKEYNDVWIQSITDVTDLAHAIKAELDKGDIEKAKSLLPNERRYRPKNVVF